MASPDVQIVRDGPTDVPLDYTLPSTAGLQPLAINAVFDGSAAASDYLPCVVIIGSSGTVIARAASDTTVGAGGDAEVSWFPGVKEGTAATFVSAPTATASILEISQNFAAGTYAPVIDTFRTNTAGASAFSQDATHPYQCNVHETGMYLITGGWSCSAFATELRNCTILTAIAGGTNFGGSLPQQEIAGQNVATSAQANLMTFSGVLGFNAGDTFYHYFTITKALSSVGPMGWTIQQVSDQLVT